ncbi:MAG: hypothetical protein AUG51_04640 [Acidobacteria bacterium 13_1_20CM_3_53_8]|nr:MAG: hypothetical protein AUG51_04640 [Acidobacteria bacterium 13_1_20CM_3_53_8]
MRAEEEEIVAVEAADEPLVVRRDVVRVERAVERSASASALAAAHLQKTYASVELLTTLVFSLSRVRS